MKTFTPGLTAKRSVLRHKSIARRLAARSVQSPQRSSPPILIRAIERVLGVFAQFVCVERKGSMVCCIPGAPIVRLPS